MPEFSGSDFYLVLDQGTSSTKCFLFDCHGNVAYTHRIKHTLYRPDPHCVECDADIIANDCRQLIINCIQFAQEHSGKIISAGLAVQRSTFLFWDKKTGVPRTMALSWQDDRAQEIVNELQDHSQWVFKKTGTPLSAHFGGAKFLHLVRKNPDLFKEVKEEKLWFGSLSAFLTHFLTGKAAIDYSIACRSQLLDLNEKVWDNELCTLFQIPLSVLPPLAPCFHSFGSITMNHNFVPLHVVMGDQQAALIGQGGLKTNSLALNFGTSGSVQYSSGETASIVEGLISSVLVSDRKNATYMVEGTINACNSLFYWFEDTLNIPHEKMHWQERCKNIDTTGIFVPGFMGIAAPYWKSAVGVQKFGLDGADKNEIIRAGMESIGFLVYDIIERLNISDQLPEILTASGGGGRPPLLQFIADLLQVPVGHSAMKDRTAYGVFCLLKKHEGESVEISEDRCNEIFEPKMDKIRCQAKLRQWHNALEKTGVKH